MGLGMGAQLDLRLNDVGKHELAFRAFHRANPEVYATLVRLARQAKQRGMEKIGIRMLWEVMRWELWIPTTDENSAYKLNDHYHSRYARLIMRQESDLDGIFQVRELKT